MKPKNIKEAKELIVKYRSITLEDIEKEKELRKYTPISSFIVPSKLTGFGSTTKCILCVKVAKDQYTDCRKCIYGKTYGCFKGRNTNTYNAIRKYSTSKELLKAFRDRANHIEKLLKSFK